MQSTPKAKLDQQTVDTAKENLMAMPPAPREMKLLTIGQAIRELTPTIAKLKRLGYSRAKILELLKEQGIACSPASFRSFYRAPKAGKRNAKATDSTRKMAGATPSPTESLSNATPRAAVSAASRPTAGANAGGARSESRAVAVAAPIATAKAS